MLHTKSAQRGFSDQKSVGTCERQEEKFTIENIMQRNNDRLSVKWKGAIIIHSIARLI